MRAYGRLPGMERCKEVENDWYLCAWNFADLDVDSVIRWNRRLVGKDKVREGCTSEG